jgi:folate-dependent phosphoribosylglycinamide formyltransferase PurN
MNSALILTSNSPRHIYFANRLSGQFDVKGIISEPKSDYFIKQYDESELVRQHFDCLARYEKKYLGEFSNFPACPILHIDKQRINEPETLRWALDKCVDVVFLFGTGILGMDWLLAFNKRIVNLHLGYSPRYRGSATLFWPFFHDELEFVGSTIHLAEASVDGGAILQVVTPDIERGDNYYDINYKTIKKAVDEMGGVVSSYLDGCLHAEKQDISAQKYLYRKADFNSKALAKVLGSYGA